MPRFAARGEDGSPPADRTGWLGHAAAPTFALMACVSAIGAPDMAICSATASLLPINDMALMYMLMSIFHLSPWARLLSGRSRRRAFPVTQTKGG